MDVAKYKGHTKSDWTLNPTGGKPTVYVELNDGYPPVPICDVVSGYGWREARANARLIADAPKLLAEVVRLRKVLREIGDFAHDRSI